MASEESGDPIIGGIEFSELYIDRDNPLGSGGYGNVYPGTYKSTPVAVKESMSAAGILASFMKEVEVLKKLRNPKIMRYIGSCKNDGKLYIVSELLGKNLLQVCTEPKPPSLFQRMKYARDGAVGVRWLHESKPGIIHRDIKPENFLLNTEGSHAVVCDFGISQFVCTDDHESAKRRKKNGTPFYLSPEVEKGEPATTKSDVYSFGLFLWFMVTCKIPFIDYNGNDKDMLIGITCDFIHFLFVCLFVCFTSFIHSFLFI